MEILSPKPVWVNEVFNRRGEPSSRREASTVTYRVVNNVKDTAANTSVTIVENPDDHKFIRMEIRNGSVSSAMAANYVMATVDEGRNIENIEQELLPPELVQSITEGLDENGVITPMIWLERCADMKSLAAIHIYPPSNIQLFDKILKRASEIGLKPFPDYINIRQ